VAWAGAWLTIVFYALKAGGWLRISAHQEAMGLDADEFDLREAYSPRGGKSQFPETKKVGEGRFGGTPPTASTVVPSAWDDCRVEDED
jgi:hypothetical protein